MEESEKHKNDVYLAQWLDGTISDKELKELVSETDYAAYTKLRKGIETYEQLEAPLDSTYEKILYSNAMPFGVDILCHLYLSHFLYTYTNSYL